MWLWFLKEILIEIISVANADIRNFGYSYIMSPRVIPLQMQIFLILGILYHVTNRCYLNIKKML